MEVPKNGSLQQVLIVEDHPAVRDGIRILLSAQADLECCGAASSIRTARTLIRRLDPDIVILDWLLGDGTARDLFVEMNGEGPRVVVYSMFDQSTLDAKGLPAAVRFVSKAQPASMLLAELRAAANPERHNAVPVTGSG